MSFFLSVCMFHDKMGKSGNLFIFLTDFLYNHFLSCSPWLQFYMSVFANRCPPPTHTHMHWIHTGCRLTLLSGCRPHHRDHHPLPPLPLPRSVLSTGASVSQSAGCVSPLSSAGAGGRDWLVWSELGRQMKCQVRSASGDSSAAS